MVSNMEDLSFLQTKLMHQDTLTQMNQDLLTQEVGHQVMDLLTPENQVMDLPIQIDKDQELSLSHRSCRSWSLDSVLDRLFIKPVRLSTVQIYPPKISPELSLSLVGSAEVEA